MALTEVNSLGIKDLEVKTADIAADAVTSAKIADDQIDSEHYVDASIDHAHLADDCVDGDNIADNSVGLAAMAHATDGVIITFDANGAPAYVGPGTDGQVLTSTGAGSPPAFEDAAGGGPSLANGAADRIVTADGANSLNGESNLTYATNLTITNGSYYVGTSGHGLDFSLTGQQSGMTSERLSNYEEGTFTVEVQNGWGILNPGYAHNTCRYTLVGRLVHCFGRLQLNAGSENSNQIYITGFPFVAANWANQHYPMATGFFNSADANGQHFAGHISPNSTYLYFHEQTSTGLSNINGDEIGDTFDLMFSITYQT